MTVTINGTTGLSTTTGSVVSNNTPGKNLAINGAMKIAQRGDTTGVEYGYGGCDRWRFSGGSAARVTMNQTTGPTAEGFAYCQELDVTTADASLAAGDYNMLSHKWEGYDLQHIQKGTSDAKSLTVSFWVSSPKTGTHIVELYDQANSRQISKAYTVSSADTWENKTVTFAGDTSGTITNDNDARLTLEFWLCAGSTYSSGTLNTSWASITNANRAVGQVNTMDNTSNNFKLTGVQVEIGDTATNFEHRSYGDEIAKCQRYYFQSDNFKVSCAKGPVRGEAYSTTELFAHVQYPQPMRAAPTWIVCDNSGNTGAVHKIGNPDVSGVSVDRYGATSGVRITKSTAWTAGDGYMFTYSVDAEL